MRRASRNEADLVADGRADHRGFAKNFDVTLHLDRERTLINGRADAVYNRFVIEYEPPNSLRKDLSARPNQHAIGQVKQYMEGLERLDRHKKERMAGAVLDGTFFIFIRYRDDHWHMDDPVPVEAHSTETFLRYLLSLSTELAVTPENLVRDFGENSNTARVVVPALYRALAATDSPKVHTLFRQWRRQFQEVTGYEPTGGQLDAARAGEVVRGEGQRARRGAPVLRHPHLLRHLHQAAGVAGGPLLPDAQGGQRVGRGRELRQRQAGELSRQDGARRPLCRSGHPQLPGRRLLRLVSGHLGRADWTGRSAG